MEFLDVVNGHDEVIDVQSRTHVHAHDLMHRASHILLFNSAGDLFLQKRSQSKDNDPGLWDSSCAGHVDTGESYLSCATRELQEELGLDVRADQLAKKFKLQPDPATGNEFAMIYTLISDQVLTLDPIEIDEGMWVDSETLDRWIIQQPETLTLVFRLIWSRLNNPGN